ncbi:ROK family transcriptional regulator [Aquibacillus rhizosphaerae]|uniref:ROK family transcriptional regulator n=1 Tax=Aquibacillus rhizosphaerae TaxID=3051431 RepID=A0ABT7L4P1_9BACI|nr:ROK family transcriptional regulator [Aquibacillus sp. LR5S19]MDL4840155.1 ROK family transcriptional regulator [Aquibacillus sp. LR5S19]
MQRGSFQWMKSMNKTIILNKIRSNGPISRAQIAKETKLTPPTVGSIVKELIEQAIVKESAQGTSQGGRKPTMLVINNSEFYIIGIDAGPKDIEFIVSDLSGKVIDCSNSIVAPDISKDEFLDQLKKGIYHLLNKYSVLKTKVIGIGVAMHGVVDLATGTSLFAPNLNLRNIPIKSALEAEFDYVVKVENDARALALGESWFSDSAEMMSMIAVNIGRGIGAGIIINGALYHGEYNIAGEIGHMTLDINGEKCECGNYGCLQTVASGPAIAKKATLSIEHGSESLLTEMKNENEEITGELIYKAALNGDELAQNILKEAGEYIGIGLTNLIHVVNPSKIIIGGGVSKSSQFILGPIKSTIKNRALTPQAKETEVVVSNLGEHATALGAVSLVLVELFYSNDPIPN